MPQKKDLADTTAARRERQENK